MAHKPKAVQEGSTGDSAPAGVGALDPQALRQEIQLRAYYRYCERGCAPGADVNDWLTAEQEVVAVHAKPVLSTKASADDRRLDRRQGASRR